MTKSLSLPVGMVWAPRLASITDGVLIPEKFHPWLLSSRGRVKRRAPNTLLAIFCNIAEAPDTERAVNAFASRWGMLGLCDHGLPYTHNPRCHPNHETVDAYKALSLCLGSLQRIGLEVAVGRRGDAVDWELTDSILYPGSPSTLEKSIPARDRLQLLIERLVSISRLQPRLAWKDGSWVIDFDALEGSNVVAILTLQLIAGIAHGALRKCRDCPRWFEPNGRQVYCAACGIRASWRAAAKRSRAKKTLADSLAGRVGKRGKKRRIRGKAP